MESLYQKIADTFNSHPEVFTDRVLPVIRQIDIHLGQPDDPESFELFLPGIFIAWEIKPAVEVGESNTLNLDFHILQEPGAGTENFSGMMDQGLEYIRLLKAIKYILNSLASEHTSPLRYAGERQAVTPFFRYHIISYTCNIDSDDETIWRPELAEGTILDINITSGMLRDHSEEPDIRIDIETFK